VRVLHVGEYAQGGIATYLNTLFKYQLKQDSITEVFLLVSDINNKKLYELKQNNIYHYNYSRKIFNIPSAIFQINSIIKQIEPDIIHVHSSFAGLFVRILYFFKKRDTPIIYCPHGWSFLMELPRYKSRIYQLIEKFLSIKTDLVINISKFEYEQSLLRGLPDEKSVVIENGVDEVSSYEEIDIVMDKNKINLLFVGRFDKQKGVDFLFELFKINNFDNVQLYTIGTKVLNDDNYDIPSCVKQLGWIDNSKIDSYYRMFDAVIVPSRWEGFGLVVIEAMKNKKPVIVSNRGALPYIVKDGVNGYIFDFDNPKELITLLKGLSKNELKRLGESAYKSYVEKYTSYMMNSKIMDCYLSFIK
jgi:glycosyltransferase involved in cell wall biosynthesis